MIKKNNMILFNLALLSFVLILFLSGCATPSSQEKRGMELYSSGDYDQAIVQLEKAFKDKPDSNLRILLFRAKLNSYYSHLYIARQYKAQDKRDEAIKEYNKALTIFPNNKSLTDELNEFITGKKEVAPPFQSSIKPPVTLKVNPVEKMDLKLRNTPITKIFAAMGKSYGVNFIFDKDFRDFVYSIEVENTNFYDLLGQLCMVSGTDYRILDKSSVLIFQDNTFKKRTFGLRGLKVFYLSNIKAEDAKKLLQTIFREQQIQVQEDTNLNTIIVRADVGSLVEVDRFINSIDKRKSEIILDVQILEITKNLTQALGVSYGDTSSSLATASAGIVDSDGKISTTMNVNSLRNTNFFLTVPSAALSFLESDDKNRIIAKPNLRGVDGEEIKFMVGDEVPVPQTQFQSSGTGGVNNVPVTTYNYKNVGVEVKLTPYIHKDNEVTIKLKLTINSVAGSENGFPTFGKRELESVIRLKEGETNIIGGFLRDEVRSGLSGIPALSRLPIIGRLFGAAGSTVKQTDVIFSITPQVIRRVDIRPEDEETIWSSPQGGIIGSSETPMPSTAEAENVRESAGDSIAVLPSKRRVPANTDTYFTIRVSTGAMLNALALGGTVSGPKAVVEEVKTDFFAGRSVQVIKNFSGSNFDLAYSVSDDRASLSVVAQIKVRFQEKGNYSISLGGITASTKEKKSVDLNGIPAEVEVY